MSNEGKSSTGMELPDLPGAFAWWLLTQYYRQDSIGHIARVAISDKHYKTTWDFEHVQDHVVQTAETKQQGAGQNVAAWLRQAKVEYDIVVDTQRAVKVDGYAILAEGKRLGYQIRLLHTSEGIQLGVTGPGVEEHHGDLQRVFTPDLYRRFLLRRDTLMQILSTDPGAGV